MPLGWAARLLTMVSSVALSPLRLQRATLRIKRRHRDFALHILYTKISSDQTGVVPPIGHMETGTGERDDYRITQDLNGNFRLAEAKVAHQVHGSPLPLLARFASNLQLD